LLVRLILSIQACVV